MFYENVICFLKATKIDAPSKKVILDNGWEINYDKCLIATGGRPRNLPIFEKDEKFSEKVTLFRNVRNKKTFKNFLNLFFYLNTRLKTLRDFKKLPSKEKPSQLSVVVSWVAS